jgi:hypothetical protein
MSHQQGEMYGSGEEEERKGSAKAADEVGGNASAKRR